MNIVLIGAGIHSFGRGQLADILQNSNLSALGVTLTLVDTDPVALDTMTRLAQRIKAHARSRIELCQTTERREALVGADYVILAVARKRMQLWEQDFRVPLAHGFRHCLGENGGPGALFHALRSLELVIPICRDIEALCPDALLLNFTNPESRTSWRHAVNVLNAGPWIDNLPASAAVEVPAIVDGNGIHPQAVGALPEPYAAYLRTQCAIVELVTEAYRTRSKKLLLQALLLDPVVNSIEAARKLLDDMLELQKAYLPAFD